SAPDRLQLGHQDTRLADYLSSEEFQRSSISYSSNSDHLQMAEVGGNRALPDIVCFSLSISDCSSNFKKFAMVMCLSAFRLLEASVARIDLADQIDRTNGGHKRNSLRRKFVKRSSKLFYRFNIERWIGLGVEKHLADYISIYQCSALDFSHTVLLAAPYAGMRPSDVLEVERPFKVHLGPEARDPVLFMRKSRTVAVQEKSRQPRAWEDVMHLDGCFIVNIGDMMERWTDSLFRSTLHRVMPTGQERYSNEHHGRSCSGNFSKNHLSIALLHARLLDCCPKRAVLDERLKSSEYFAAATIGTFFRFAKSISLVMRWNLSVHLRYTRFT
ncbi:hypothetical protein LINPERPRIM_LOCUS1794, partial [Linum perenne]